MNLDATVINCHTNTKNLKQFTKQADILITATGEIGLITKDHVQNDAVVLDVGFLREIKYMEMLSMMRVFKLPML